MAISSSRSPGSAADFRRAIIVSATAPNHADPRSALRVLTDVAPRPRRQPEAMSNDRLRNRWVIFGAAGALAAVIAVVLIAVSVVGSSDSKTAATTTSSPSTVERTGGTIVPARAGPAKLPGAAADRRALQGHSPALNVLGKPDAPVTMIEFADLQCPYCRAYAIEALPALVDQYVRTGKARFVFSGMHFIGPDSRQGPARRVRRRSPEPSLAVPAPPLPEPGCREHRLGHRRPAPIGRRVDPGLRHREDAGRHELAGRDATRSLPPISRRRSARVNPTPTFFAGKTGGTLEHVNVTALTPDGFRPTLDALTS